MCIKKQNHKTLSKIQCWRRLFCNVFISFSSVKTDLFVNVYNGLSTYLPLVYNRLHFTNHPPTSNCKRKLWMPPSGKYLLTVNWAELVITTVDTLKIRTWIRRWGTFWRHSSNGSRSDTAQMEPADWLTPKKCKDTRYLHIKITIMGNPSKSMFAFLPEFLPYIIFGERIHQSLETVRSST